MAAGISPPFRLWSVYDGRKRKAENDDGQHSGGTLEKVFHTFTTFILKTCPRSYLRGGCAPCPVYPLTLRAALALSQTRSGGGRSAPGSFCYPLPSLSFSFRLSTPP